MNRYNQWKRKQQKPPSRPRNIWEAWLGQASQQPLDKQYKTYLASLSTRNMPKPEVLMPEIKSPPVRPARTKNQTYDYFKQVEAAQKTRKPRKPRYNQAAYLAGLQSAPMTMGQKMKPQQGIYKPYANGGGVRKPKYNKKG